MAFVLPHVSSARFPGAALPPRCRHSRTAVRVAFPRARAPTMSTSAPQPDVPDVLKAIIERKVVEVADLKAELAADPEHPVAAMLARRGSLERKKAFYSALDLPKGSLTVIAEIKRRSPSAGQIGVIRDPAYLSGLYYDAGAACISVLTDLEGFGGTMDDLRAVVKAQKKFKDNYPGPCPVLRKDFIIDEVQIAEAALAGASAVLLIVSALGAARTKELLNATHDFGLDALVEVHDEAELAIALEAGAEIVGVNNRDLRTFQVSLDTSFNLASKMPDNVLKISESGISDCLSAWKLRDAGYRAVLVGETLVKASESVSDNSNPYAAGFNQAKGIIKSYKAKGSVEFGNASMTTLFGKGEAAKETLGEMSI